jgi:hypothetical protein
VLRIAVGALIGGVVGLAILGVLVASLLLQGSRLGRLIEKSLPENRGKLQIGGVTWRLRALGDIVTDAPSPITVDGLRIVDPEGTVVLDVPHLEARVKLRTLIGGSFSIRDLRIAKMTWRFAQLGDGTGIGFLAALAPKHPAPPPPPRPAGAPEPPGSFFEIAGAELGDLDAVFDFPGAWGLELRHAHAVASLLQTTVDPKHPFFGFDVGSVVAEGGGWLRILDDNVLPFDRVAITRVATTRERPDDIVLDLERADTGRSHLTGKGFFTGIYGVNGAQSVPGIDLHAEIADAGDALAAVAAGKKIDGLAVGGDGASVRLDLSEPFAQLKVAGAFRGLDVRYGDYRALNLGLDLAFDGGAGVVAVKKLGFEAPGGGRMELDARLAIAALKLKLDARLADLRTDSYLPPELRAMAAGRISGRVEATGDLGAKALTLDRVDLRLARTRGGALPKVIRVHGDARLSPSEVRTSGLIVDVTGASATAKGALNVDRDTVNAAVSVVAADLAALLGEMGLPPLAHDARVGLSVGGSLAAPTARGDAVVHGLGAEGRTLPELKAAFSLGDGAARVDSLTGRAFGGTLDASGALRLYEQTTRHMLRTPELDLKIGGHDLDLGALAGRPDVISGRLSFDGRAAGPIDAVTADLHVPAGTPITVLGDDYELGPVDVGLVRDHARLRKVHLSRKSGGTLDLSGDVDVKRRELAIDVVLARLPLEGLPGLASAGVPLSGFVEARLHVSGRPDRPMVAGDVTFDDVVARGVRLGQGRLTLGPAPGGDGSGADKIAVAGDLFGRFHVDTQIALGARGPAVHGVVEFQRVAIEALAPEMVAFADGRGVVSGRVAVDVVPGQPLSLDLWLQELALSIAREVEGPNGETTVQRVHVEAAQALHVAARGGEVQLDDVRFKTDGGDFRAAGRVSLGGGTIAGQMSGHLDLELLQPFLRGTVDKLSGDLKVAVDASGTLDKPVLSGRVDVVNAVKVRPKGFESDLALGSGSFQLDSGGVRVDGVALTVEGSTMNLSGRAALGPGFRPEEMRADLDGDISARLLAFVAPDAVSDAQGTAHIRAMIRGTPAHPEVHGRLDLGAIDFRLRDLGTEVQVQSGLVELSNDGVILHNVRVRLDDGGTLVIGASGVRAGQVAFTSLIPFQPGDVDLPLHGERLTYRSPETFEIDDLAFDLSLQGSVDEGFNLGGEVRLVSGRYLQDFKVQQLVISPRVNESSVRPFYEGKPLLENLALDLGVRTVGDGFVVQNNIAPEIHVDIALNIGGTLATPTLAGEVRPTDGRFHLPGMRGDFDLTPNVNHVIFIATKSVAAGETPELNIEAQNLVPDATGNDHNVRMHIHGPMREAQIDLASDDGLDRNQTALLLLTGRTTTDTQRFGTQSPTVGANLNSGADLAGQLTRDAVANLMEPYIDDTFQRVTGLNLRLTVGPDGFEGRIRKRVSRYLNFQADTLLGFQNQSRQSLQLDAWLIDYLSLGFGLERITLSSQQGVPETLPMNGSLELRWDFAIRR